MPSSTGSARTSRGGRSQEAIRAASNDLTEAAERYGFTQSKKDLAGLRKAAIRAAAAGLTAAAMARATRRGVELGDARRVEATPVPLKVALAPASLAPETEPASAKATPSTEKKRSRRKAEPQKPVGPMVASPFYPTQPCGLSYKDFRVGHTYKDAYHMLMRPQEEGVYHTISQSAVLRQLSKMKRQTYEQYLSDCVAQEQYEIEQAHGGREGDYAQDSGEFDVSFDPSEFAPAEPEDFIAFNPRRRRTSRHVAARRRLAPNPKIVSLGPHALYAAAGVSMNGRRTSRRPRKVTSRKSARR